MAITLRTLKGSRLTHKELDDNFRHFTGSHTVDGTVTATAFVGDGSGLTNLPAADLTGTGILSGSIQIAELGAGIVSGSSQLDGEIFGFGADIVATGSFTGSFIGDGSGLTNLPGASLNNTGILSGSIQIAELGAGIVSGSNWKYTPNSQFQGWEFTGPTALGGNFVNYGDGVSVNGPTMVFGGQFNSLIRFDNANLRFFASANDSWFNGEETVNIKSWNGHVSASLFSGSFYGDGSNLTGVTAVADLTGTGVISGSGFVHNNPGGGVFPTWTLNEYISLNKGLSVLAGGNNPFVTIDSTSGNTTDPVLKVLGSNYTEELVVTNTEVQINEKLTLNSQFSNGGIIPTTNGLVTARVFQDGANFVGHVSASLFSGSFYGDGSNLTGITPDLAGTGIVSGSNWSYVPNNLYQGWHFDGPVKLGNSILTYGNQSVNGSHINIGNSSQTTAIRFDAANVQFFASTQDMWNTEALIMLNGSNGKGSFSSFAIRDTSTSPATQRAQINGLGQAQFNSLTIDNNSSFNGDITSLGDVNHMIQSGEVFKVTAGNGTSQIFRVNGDKEAVLNATLTVSDFDQNTLASADFTGATEGVSGSFSGSFEGDGSGLTGVTAVADLTGTGIVSGSGLEYDSIVSSHWSLDNKNLELHNGGRLAVRSLDSNTPLTNKFVVTDANNTLVLGVNYSETNIGNQLIVGTSTQNAIQVGPSRLLPKAVIRNDGTALFKGIASDGKIDFTTATQGVSGSFSGSFEGDGSGLTGLPAGNVPFIAGTTLPAKASSVTGSMILIENQGGPGNDGAELYIYNGASGTGWRQIQLV